MTGNGPLMPPREQPVETRVCGLLLLVAAIVAVLAIIGALTLLSWAVSVTGPAL